MGLDLLRRAGLMLIFTLVQVLILNHIHLFNYATPLIYIYFVVLMPRNYPRWLNILVCFIFGIIIDSFSNTPGEAVTSMTLVSFLQPYILNMYLEREDADDFHPAMASMGFFRYSTYVMLIAGIFCFTFFAIEAFTIYNILHAILCMVGSWLLSVILILCIDSVRK